MSHTVIIFYKYVNIPDPQKIMEEQKELCTLLGLKGRTIIATEGINSTLEGKTEDIEKYIDYMNHHELLKDIYFKYSEGTGTAFPRLSIKVRVELVSAHLGENDIDPNKTTGKYLQPEELNKWFETGKEFYIVDMRNNYEQKSGHFEGSILSEFENFRDLPTILPKIENIKDKTILTVCTAGIRCEKASGFLVKHGFTDVYQLYGGMHAYMEKYPTDKFLGKLYVFDQRVVVAFGENKDNEVIIGECEICKQKSENYVNCSNLLCHKHLIICKDCIEEQNGIAACSPDCLEKCKIEIEKKQEENSKF